MHAPFDGTLPDGWSGGTPVTKYWGGNFTHLYKVTRPCATCGVEIAIDVTKQALQGTKKNAGLLLRNCPKCRAERKAGGPGSRGGTSRPVTIGEPPPPAGSVVIDAAELEQLRMANKCMKEELDGLYAAAKRKVPWE